MDAGLVEFEHGGGVDRAAGANDRGGEEAEKVGSVVGQCSACPAYVPRVVHDHLILKVAGVVEAQELIAEGTEPEARTVPNHRSYVGRQIIGQRYVYGTFIERVSGE